MNEPSLHKAPTIVSTHNAAVSYYNPTGRPPTIAELTEIAQAHDWGDGPDLNWQVARGERNLKYWLLLAQELRNDAENFERRGRIADAFVQYAKSARIVMEGLPAHPDYQTLLTQQQRLNLRLNGQDILTALSNLKPALVDTYDRWMREHGLDSTGQSTMPLLSPPFEVSIMIPAGEREGLPPDDREHGHERSAQKYGNPVNQQRPIHPNPANWASWQPDPLHYPPDPAKIQESSNQPRFVSSWASWQSQPLQAKPSENIHISRDSATVRSDGQVPWNSAASHDIDLIQNWLDTSDIYHPDRQLQIKRLVDYATRHDGSINLPHGLLINGVRIEGAGAPIAGGSFADVFVGVYRDQSVAVKRFRAFPSDTDEKDKVYTRFCREALTWRQLRHPQILPFLGIDQPGLESRSSLSMISPWMAQGTLMEYLKKSGSTPIPHGVLIADVASGLRYLHAQKFAHGDLHGSNVFINEYTRALLGDFGLTAVTDMAHPMATTTINKAGAVRWIGPELVHQDDGPPPRKTSSGDIFAFGRICLSIYTRLIPYHTINHDAGVLLRVIQHRHPSRPTREECHGYLIPDALWDLVLRCWTADSEARPSAQDVFKALKTITF